jgi:DNA/RNA-binding domain of Phe-tRNA-synthetase-like protein
MFIKINPNLFEKQNDLLIGVVAAEGINNKIESKEIEELLTSVVAQQKQIVSGQQVKEFKEFEPYHAAMRNFGISLSRFQMSVEAMLKRLSKGDDIPSISPVVDLANAVSLQYHVPIGVHDIDSLIEDLEIRYVRDDDVFEGSDDSTGFDREELVYASGNSIRTRRWIWRQMPAGRTNRDSKNLVFPIDGFSENMETILTARDTLSSHLKKFFGCNIRVGLIDKNSPSFKILG